MTCELCGRFEAVMEDPIWTVAMTPKPFNVCELCAKDRIESKMYEVVN